MSRKIISPDWDDAPITQSDFDSGKLVPRKRNPNGSIAGLPPDGDVRLTANIRQGVHLRLKLAAAHQRTTIGEILENLVEQHLPQV